MWTRCVLYFVLAATASAETRHWSDLPRQVTGRRVTVISTGRRAVTGNVTRMDAASMRLVTDSGPVDLPRGSVTELRVHADRRGSTLGVVMGALCGTAIGLLAGHGPGGKKILNGQLLQHNADGTYTDITPQPQRHYGTGAAIGAGAGGLFGWWLGRRNDQPGARYTIVD